MTGQKKQRELQEKEAQEREENNQSREYNMCHGIGPLKIPKRTFCKKVSICRRQKWPCDRLTWFKFQKISKCQKDVKCQKVKHVDYEGGSQKKIN